MAHSEQFSTVGFFFLRQSILFRESFSDQQQISNFIELKISAAIRSICVIEIFVYRVIILFPNCSKQESKRSSKNNLCSLIIVSNIILFRALFFIFHIKFLSSNQRICFQLQFFRLFVQVTHDNAMKLYTMFHKYVSVNSFFI